MKNILKLLLYTVTAVIFFNYQGSLYAQYKYSKKSKVEISASGAYFFGGIMPVNLGELNFVNNYGFQGAITYNLMQGAAIDLSYMYVPTELRFRDFQNYGEETKLFDMDIHYFFIDYLYKNEGRQTVPYGIIGMGGFFADPKGDSVGSEFRFAMNFGGGINVYPSSSIGLKFQARLLVPFYYATTTVYVSPTYGGYGTGAGTLLQADISAGIIIKF